MLRTVGTQCRRSARGYLMASQRVGAQPAGRPLLRHPAEFPFFGFMVALNVLIVAVIVQAAVSLWFLPQDVQDSAWGTTIRTAFFGFASVFAGTSRTTRGLQALAGQTPRPEQETGHHSHPGAPARHAADVL